MSDDQWPKFRNVAPIILTDDDSKWTEGLVQTEVLVDGEWVALASIAHVFTYPEVSA